VCSVDVDFDRSLEISWRTDSALRRLHQPNHESNKAAGFISLSALSSTLACNAKKLLRQRLAEVRTKTFIPLKTQKTMISELAEDLIRDYRTNGMRSIGDLEARWEKHLKPFFGERRAGEVDGSLVTKYINDRQEEGAANATINRELAALKRMFTLGKRAKKVAAIPFIPMLKENNRRKGFLRSKEHDALATATAKVGLWLRAMFELGCTFGWRKAEMLGLKVKQIDLLAGTIRLEPGTTKNGEGREVSMTLPLKVLLTQCCLKKAPEDPVFTREDKSPVRDFRKTWEKVCCEVGLGERVCPTCYPELQKQTLDADGQCSACERKWKRQQLKYVGLLVHDLRRTAARNLRNSGTAEEVIMEIGGWKTPSVFKRYAIVDQTDIRTAMTRLEVKQERDRAEAAVQEQAENLGTAKQFGHSLGTAAPKTVQVAPRASAPTAPTAPVN
jgi:integrase